MEKNNQTQIERRNRGQVQRDLLLSTPSWVARFTKFPLQRKAPMDQPMQVKLLKNKGRRVVEMEELLKYQSETQTKKIKAQMTRVFEELMTCHVQQCIQKNKKRMDEVLQELMTFQEQRKAEKTKEQMRTVLTEIMMFHSQQKMRTSKKLMTRVFAELMTYHAQQRTKQIKEKMRQVCAELMTIHAQREAQTEKMMKRMQLVFDELLQINTERKKLKLLEEEEFVPRKLFLFNIISFKQTDDDHLLQGPRYPDLSSLVASAELELPPESLDGACYVVDDENEGDDEEKMEIPSNNLEKKKNGWRRRIRKFLGLK
ncbi:uncharacterized protein [Magallana gigas]|uniref:uncharacterized protein isoform X2 n=1 Tax=Magallana gigas TaxID=29159 RepID=UPI003342BBC0